MTTVKALSRSAIKTALGLTGILWYHNPAEMDRHQLRSWVSWHRAVVADNDARETPQSLRFPGDPDLRSTCTAFFPCSDSPFSNPHALARTSNWLAEQNNEHDSYLMPIRFREARGRARRACVTGTGTRHRELSTSIDDKA